jgi:hypothetical protein
MQKYVEQLAHDMQKATEKKAGINALKLEEDDSFNPFEGIENILLGPYYKLSEIVGFAAELLPDDSLLSDEQTALLASKMVALLDVWNFFPEFPKDNGMEVPPRLRYRAMRKAWEVKYAIAGNVNTEIVLCSDTVEDCPFEGYCNRCAEGKTDVTAETDSPVEEEDFIPSIFNYCDRWCERCDFTAKCRSFSMEEEFLGASEASEKPQDEINHDIEDQMGKFLGPGFGNSENDFPFNSDDDDDDDDDNHGFFSPEKKSERHPLSIQTMAYSDSASLWLDSVKSTCKNNFKRWLALGAADQIFDAIDTVNWYHTLIYPKIRRALSGYFESGEDEYAAYDMNGSAKVTLLGIDNSIAAFNFLKRHLKTHLTEMAGLTIQLTALRNDIEILFPDARSFIRPGFDE